MRILACAAAVALIGVAAIPPAEAQPRSRYHPGWGYPGYGYRHPHGFGGAAAAGVVGGLVLGGLAAAAPAYGYPYGPVPPYAPGIVVAPGVPGYVEGIPAAGPVGPPDLYAAPHEIRGGYRTVYVPGRGRVIVGPPLY
jgi:hypothetical protein